jgi:hypothetical protein
MDIDKKIVAAIGSAVTAYIQAERSAEQAASPAARPSASAWSQSGRQEIMRNRQMWQLHIVPK